MIIAILTQSGEPNPLAIIAWNYGQIFNYLAKEKPEADRIIFSEVNYDLLDHLKSVHKKSVDMCFTEMDSADPRERDSIDELIVEYWSDNLATVTLDDLKVEINGHKQGVKKLIKALKETAKHETLL